MVELLLGLDGHRRVNVHARDEAAFRAACHGGHIEVVNLLLALDGDRRVDALAGTCDTIDFDDDIRSGMASACRQGHVTVVRLLLSLDATRRVAGEDINICFREACLHGKVCIPRLLLSLAGDRAVGAAAVGRGFIIACGARLKAGGPAADVSPACAASGCGNLTAESDPSRRHATLHDLGGHEHEDDEDDLALVQLLLALEGEYGDKVTKAVNSGCNSACTGGRLDVVELLLGLGGPRLVSPFFGTHSSILTSACHWGNIDLVEALLALDGDRRIHTREHVGAAFVQACTYGTIDMVKLLLTNRTVDMDRY